MPPKSDIARILSACDYIGINPADFNLRNSIFLRDPRCSVHGIGHIYRTMIACALLGEILQKPRAGLLAFCGAYIHDLARMDDGIEPEHGKRAVDLFFRRFDALWERYSLTSDERLWVMQAVEQHSTREWMQPTDEGYDVMAILKDADALDRCRLGENCLDPKFLRYPRSRGLIEDIARYYDKTQWTTTDIAFMEFIHWKTSATVIRGYFSF